MKKLLLIVFLMFALVVTIVACTGDPATNETTAGTTEDETPTEAPETEPETPTKAPETEPVDPMAPVNVFEAADIFTITRPDLGSLTPDCVSIVDNYLHIVPIGPDPYWYPFFNVDGARYLVIRYRTDATDVYTQFYIGSSGEGPIGDENSLKQPVIADGEWHLAIFDTQPITDLGLYDGSTVSFFRFDVLEGIHNVEEGGRYPLPEGCYIDVEYVAFFHSLEAAEAYDYTRQNTPIAIGNAAHLAGQTATGNEMKAGEVTTEYDRTFVRLTAEGGDPYFSVMNPGANLKANFMAISYRTNSTSEGQFFIGSGAVITAQGDNFNVNWNEGGWNLLVIDLSAVEGLTSITDAIVNYLRMDFFTDGGAEGDYFDIEYVAFFKTAEAAETYYNDLHALKTWDSEAGKTIVKHHNFDALPVIGADGSENHVIFGNGAAAGWDKVATIDFSVNTLKHWGWVGVYGELGEFGYQIDDGEYIFSSDFAVTPEQGVIDAVGADATASRMGILIDVSALAGEHTVTTVYKNAAGYVVELLEFTVVRKNADLTLDMATFEGQAGYMANFEAAGYTAPCYKYGYGTVLDLGEMDLSKFSAVKITYGCDGGEGTAAAFESASSLVIGLKSAASTFGQETEDNFDDAIAYTDMVFSTSGWAGGSREAVVDLSDIDYNGNVWVALHNPAGTEIVVSAIVFVGSDELPVVEDPEEPEAPAPIVPVAMGDAAYLAEKAAGGTDVAAGEVTTEDDRTFVRLTATGGDPYFMVVAPGANIQSDIVAISYRTNSAAKGQFYVGSGAGITANGDNCFFEWTEGGWNLLVIDLSTVEELTSITGDMVNFLRLDFFHNGTFAEGDYLDIEYVAFFESVADAETYYNDLHPVVDEAPEA